MESQNWNYWVKVIREHRGDRQAWGSSLDTCVCGSPWRAPLLVWPSVWVDGQDSDCASFTLNTFDTYTCKDFFSSWTQCFMQQDSRVPAVHKGQGIVEEVWLFLLVFQNLWASSLAVSPETSLSGSWTPPLAHSLTCFPHRTQDTGNVTGYSNLLFLKCERSGPSLECVSAQSGLFCLCLPLKQAREDRMRPRSLSPQKSELILIKHLDMFCLVFWLKPNLKSDKTIFCVLHISYLYFMGPVSIINVTCLIGCLLLGCYQSYLCSLILSHRIIHPETQMERDLEMI